MAVAPGRQDQQHATIDIGQRSPIERLREDFGIDERDLARALGVDRRTLARWASGDTYPRHGSRDRLRKLVALHARLWETWRTAEDARRWLHRSSPFLGDMAPIDAVRAGRFDRVEAALEAIDSGFAS
jgi:transcriptional regulator with XRE-family HTH domain